MIKINIYILCYNEELLIKNTIEHYKSRFPNCNIIIMDNYSTDNSIKIAEEYGCIIYKWESDVINEFKYLELKNNIWKNYDSDWAIVVDMDELLELNYNELLIENNRYGSSIILTKGVNIVAESQEEDISDLNLNELKDGYYDRKFSKSVCFNVNKIKNINYNLGCHNCKPEGIIKMSKKRYILKHLNYLGEKYYIKKILNRYKRKSEYSKENELAVHYIDNINIIKNTFKNVIKKRIVNYI
jgi:hypothetical protein